MRLESGQECRDARPWVVGFLSCAFGDYPDSTRKTLKHLSLNLMTDLYFLNLSLSRAEEIDGEPEWKTVVRIQV